MPSTRPQRPYNVRYYATHRLAELDRVKKRQDATLAFLRDLRRVPCDDCREMFPPHMMDFDHRDPSKKLFPIASSHAVLMSRTKLLAELEKCDIVCANCHAIRTSRQRAEHDWGWPSGGKGPRLEYRRERWRAQTKLLDELRAVPCTDCGETYPSYVMQFDHRDSTTKTHLVTQMIGHAGTVRILEEAAKCDIVCANCHRQRTYVRRTMAA